MSDNNLSNWTDRELVHERFQRKVGVHRELVVEELERRGYTVFGEGRVPRSEENMLGQEMLRRRKEHREGHCGLKTHSTEEF